MADQDQGFRGFGEQTLHYFMRPHENVHLQPVDCEAAWIGSKMPPLAQMAYVLSEAEVAEIEAGLAIAKASSKQARDMLAEDFPLPNLSKQIAAWRDTLDDGLGFQVIRGVPVERWSQEDAELFFWCFGLHLGRPGGQNPEEHLLGHVRNTDADKTDPMVRLYQTSANIEYHCDAADVVGLLCLKKAKSGGHSRIVSSVAVFNELVRRRPDLAARLYEPMWLDTRNDDKSGEITCIPIEPCRYADGKLKTFYHADYFRSADRHANVEFSDIEKELMDVYEEIAADPNIYLDMDLEPGDIQLLSNHTNLHARTEYEDYDDPSERRHLLRLWLSI